MIEVRLQGDAVEVDGLDADWVLDLARDAETMARQAERAKLRAANRWADLHAATAESGVEVWGNAGALDCEVPIGGEGTPTLAAFSVEPLGAALGISTLSAMNLISAAVELKHRLPGLWALSEALAVPAWKLKLVARLTGGLSAEAAAYVDAQLAPVLATRGGPTIERVVAEAVARFQPEDAAEAERAGKAAWDVRITHPGPGEWASTSWLDATADSLELTKFGDLVADIARRLGEAGDPDTLEQRRAKAIGIVADVHAGADLDDLITALVTPTGDPEPVRRPRVRARDLQLYLHLEADDLDTPGPGGIAAVAGLGAVTLGRIEALLARHTAAGGPDPGHPGPRPRRDGRGGPARPAGVDGRPGAAARPALCVPLLPDPRPRLRPGPRRPLRRHRTTRPDEPAEPRTLVPATSPGQERQAMPLRTHRGRVICLDLTPTRSTTSSRTAAPSPSPATDRVCPYGYGEGRECRAAAVVRRASDHANHAVRRRGDRTGFPLRRARRSARSQSGA